MLFQEPKKQESQIPYKFLGLAVLLSLICGGAAGSGATWLLAKNFNGASILDGQNSSTSIADNKNAVWIDMDSATIDVVKKSSPSVVSIIISKEVAPVQNIPDLSDLFQGWPFQFKFEQPIQPSAPSQDKPQKQEIGGGSGFIVSEDGLILTNKHVVVDEEAEYDVITNDGQKYPATVLAKDSINDLAVIKIDAKNLTPLALGDSEKIQIGQTVIAIGNTLSEFRNTVTRGVISGINRRVEAGGQDLSEVLEEAIQTDAAINPGNSGGPLLNLQGEAIGINTAISQSGQLIGFAIPINEAKQVIDSVKKNGKIVRPFLGVRYTIINKEIAEANKLDIDYGALISPLREASQGQTPEEIAIVPGSPADKAGLVENDIILEVNSERIDENHSLARMLSQYAPGDEVTLKIWHKGEEKTVKVKLEERKE